MEEKCLYNVPLRKAEAVQELVNEGVFVIQEGEQTLCQRLIPMIPQLIKKGTDITCYGHTSPRCPGSFLTEK